MTLASRPDPRAPASPEPAAGPPGGVAHDQAPSSATPLATATAAVSGASQLGRRAARGALAMIFGQLGRIAVQFGGVLILARVLSPEDYGAFAMVTAVVGLGELLQDFGLSSAAIQAPQITRAQASNLFWINTSIGFALSLTVFLSAPAVAAFYHRPELIAITRALAPTFLINGMVSQLRAQLTRNFRMGALSIAVVSAQTAGICAGLIAALRGLGTWALVVQQLSFNTVNLAVIACAARFWPDLPARHVGTRSFLQFGGNLMATQLIAQLSRNLNTVLIGNRFGSELAGLYDRAFMLLMLPLNQINVPANTVALPTLSKLQDDRARFDRFLLHGQIVLLHVLLAVFAYAAAVGDVLIAVVMGDKWLPAAPLFRILTVAGAFQAASYANAWAFTAKGLTHQLLRYSMLTRAGLVLLLLGALRWGVTGVTAAYSAGLGLMWPLGLLWLRRTSNAPVAAMLKNALRCLLAYVLCAAAAYWAAHAAMELGRWAQIGASALGMLGCMSVLFGVWPAYRLDLRAIVETRSLLRRRSV